MKQDQFRNRYLIKLAGSVVIIFVNAIIQFLLPRAFTVEEYGYYNYNLNVFVSVLGIANLSTTDALIAKFSKRRNELGYVTFYIKFWILAVIILNVGVCLLFPLLHNTFSGETLLVVMLALEAQIVTQFISDSIIIFDVMAVSRFPAAVQILMKIALSAMVIGGYMAGNLSIVYFYCSQIVIGALAVMYMLRTFYREYRVLCPEPLARKTEEYIREFYDFCRPLIVANVFAQLVAIFTNWALLRWSGAVGQAIFGAAWQLNSMVSFVFSPYTGLCKREFSVLIKDEKKLREHFINGLKLVTWITSYFALFIGFTTEWLLPVVFGEKYVGAGVETLIIMLYTIYSACAQMKNALLTAYEKSRLAARLSMIGQVISLICIFLFQMPNFIWPDTLGTIGIALTYLVPMVVNTAIGLYFCTKILGLPFVRIEFMKMPAIFICSILSILLVKGMNLVMVGNSLDILAVKILVAGIVYTCAVVAVILLHPASIGMTRERLLALSVIKYVSRMKGNNS